MNLRGCLLFRRCGRSSRSPAGKSRCPPSARYGVCGLVEFMGNNVRSGGPAFAPDAPAQDLFVEENPRRTTRMRRRARPMRCALGRGRPALVQRYRGRRRLWAGRGYEFMTLAKNTSGDGARDVWRATGRLSKRLSCSAQAAAAGCRSARRSNRMPGVEGAPVGRMACKRERMAADEPRTGTIGRRADG